MKPLEDQSPNASVTTPKKVTIAGDELSDYLTEHARFIIELLRRVMDLEPDPERARRELRRQIRAFVEASCRPTRDEFLRVRWESVIAL